MEGSLWHFYTMQEHQWILTNATISKDSEIGILMVVYEKFFSHVGDNIIYWKKISFFFWKVWGTEITLMNVPDDYFNSNRSISSQYLF